jgi:uncharacterized protein YcbX
VASVVTISIAPVKGTRLIHPPRVELTERGVVENRRFLVVGEDGRHLRSETTAWTLLVTSRYDAADEELVLTFPDGTSVRGTALPSRETVVTYVEPGHRRVEMQIVEGPWTEHLSRLAGAPVRLARPHQPGASLTESVTILSTASVERLEREAGQAVDSRRFRMLFTVDGLSEHEEDTWEGRRVRIGDATVRVAGPVDRCVVTTRHPETSERDLDVLRMIKDYRGMPRKYVDFGMFATVEEPGTVRVGDAVSSLALRSRAQVSTETTR